MKYTLDATDQSLGRLASKIAVLLRGKANPAYQPYMLPTDTVTVQNVSKIKFTGAKLTDKKYYHYSGFPGGMKTRTLGTEFKKDPKKLLRATVLNMLAQNRLRSKIIKNLIFE